MPANASGYDATCLSTIETYTDGADYPTNGNDYERGSSPITSHPATLADVTAAIEGKISVTIPPTGLGYIELYGWNGDSGFGEGDGELLFYAASPYVGQDTVDLDIIPNASCVQKPISVRPLDLISYLTTTDVTMKCPNAAVTGGTLFIGTMTTEILVPDVTDYFGGLQTGAIASTGPAAGTATIMSSTTVGPDDCLSFSTTLATTAATSCAVFGEGLCSVNGEFELPVIQDTYVTNSRDPMIVPNFAGMVVGAVFTAAKLPQQGATVTLDDPTLGQVVYVDIDTTNSKLVPSASQAATSTSGLFILYTNDVVDATVAAGGITKKLRFAAVDEEGNEAVPAPAPSSATIVMTPGTTP